MPTNHRSVGLPPRTVCMPLVDVNDVYPVLCPESGGDIRGDRLAYQWADRSPDWSNAEPLASNVMDHSGRVVTLAIDACWRCISHQHNVLRLDPRKLLSRRLQDRWMTYDHDLCSDRPVANEEPGPAKAYLLADPWIDRRNSGD